MSLVTTHVLDTSTGTPAAGLTVVLERLHGDPPVLASADTDGDGRVRELGPPVLEPGGYRLRFNTGAYFVERGVASFHPEVSVTFEVGDADHYHVPLLLSPFGYTTYRGS